MNFSIDLSYDISELDQGGQRATFQLQSEVSVAPEIERLRGDLRKVVEQFLNNDFFFSKEYKLGGAVIRIQIRREPECDGYRLGRANTEIDIQVNELISSHIVFSVMESCFMLEHA